MSSYPPSKNVRQLSSSKAFPWESSLQYLKGVGPNRAFLLGKLGLHILEDLLYYIPFRYEDRSQIKKIAHLKAGGGGIETVFGEIIGISLSETRHRRMKIVDAALSDGSAVIHAKWFNQAYLKDLIKKGSKLMLSGKIKANYYGSHALEMENPQFEKVDGDETQIHMNRIVPVYHETKGFTSRQIRVLIKQVLDKHADHLPEMFPKELINEHKLLSLSEAIVQIHFPQNGTDLSQLNQGKSAAHRRLVFDELFLLEIGLALRKKGRTEKLPGIAFNVSDSLLKPMKKRIPFQLTDAQERVFSDIQKDMALPYPMNRLLQGDVGCGKTIVALMTILIAIENGYQTALMAPTEILAEQHYFSLKEHLEALGKSVYLLTSDMKKRMKNETLEAVLSGQSHLLIGTHALIDGSVQFQRLGLVVVDEQHKFGVLQRAKLAEKGLRPDILIMTATPIPRTLALTLYGDLNISVIDELPPGRAPVLTQLYYGKRRAAAYQKVEKTIAAGRQAFIVYPLVEASEKLDLKAAIEMFAHFQKEVFPDRRIGLLHGRLKREEKETIMRDFKMGKIDLLVATTVVEVGIDIPNATMMVIEHAERFGLSQLHQLRGRVGRGEDQSHCLMIAEFPISKEGKRRLKAMLESTDGFKIAEEDLSIRGPGEFFGTRQSGIPELAVANLIRDAALLETARQEAFSWVADHPGLDDTVSRAIRACLERKWKGKLEWLTTA